MLGAPATVPSLAPPIVAHSLYAAPPAGRTPPPRQTGRRTARGSALCDSRPPTLRSTRATSACRVCHVQDGQTALHRAAKYSSSVAVVKALLAADPEAVKEKDKVRRPRPSCGCGLSPPASRLVAQPPLGSPCVPRTGREDAPPPRCSVQPVGGGGAGAARGVPGGRQGDGQGTPPAAVSALIGGARRPLRS